MKAILALLMLFAAEIAYSGTAPSSQSFGASHVDQFRNGTPGMLIFKGMDDNQSYMVQGDPADGSLLVSIAGGGGITVNYSGPTGDPVPDEAAYVGGIDDNGDMQGLSVDTDGQLQVDVVTMPAVTVTPHAYAYSDSIVNLYASTNVTTSEWVEIKASTAAAIKSITLFDSCGQTLELGVGAEDAETRILLIPPGGIDGQFNLSIAASSRLALKAITGNCSSGSFVMTGFQ